MTGTTGEKCPESGLWKCVLCGKPIFLRKNNTFPLCTRCHITTWTLVRDNRKKSMRLEIL